MYNNQYYDVPDWARFIGKKNIADAEVFVYELNPLVANTGVEYRVQKVGLDIRLGVIPC